MFTDLVSQEITASEIKLTRRCFGGRIENRRNSNVWIEHLFQHLTSGGSNIGIVISTGVGTSIARVGWIGRGIRTAIIHRDFLINTNAL